MEGSNSFRNWLRHEITQVLNRKTSPLPFLVWCDQQQVWRDLLLKAAEGGQFELWADDVHELVLRERFHQAPRTPRVIWLPKGRDAITYFEVFVLQAEEAIEWTLPEALSRFGVDIPSDQLYEMEQLLPAHAKEWVDRVREDWRELTPYVAKDTVVNDDLVLEILATPGTGSEEFINQDRYPIFRRRVQEDFGLPEPDQAKPDVWRAKATAVLLTTDAAAKAPHQAPSNSALIIPSGGTRERAMKLLTRWQKRVDLVDHFEELASKADAIASLVYWAKGLSAIPAPLASPAAERAIFSAELETLTKLETFAELQGHLVSHEQQYRQHARGFWGAQAKEPVNWTALVNLAVSANLLAEHEHVSVAWKAVTDATEWFTKYGWQVDLAGEIIFKEEPHLLGALVSVRARLRKAYQRHLDKTNSAWSELLHKAGTAALNLPFAGDVLGSVMKSAGKDPVAVVILDACRYDLGCRLAELLNEGETATRATVETARAPLPSVTAVGMPFALPGAAGRLKVDVKGESLRVMADDHPGDLSLAGERREWLSRNYKLKDEAFLSIEDLLDPGTEDRLTLKALGKAVFVFAGEFDTNGHDGQLKLTGAEDHLERYARVVRRLRSIGYSTVAVVTDHGFFHWDPDLDEVEPKPSGEILWASRRAVLGHGLKHPTALQLDVPGSDLTCAIPRSINAFKTYGGLGYFHGGATMQEVVIPVVIARWPKKARKVDVVLKPLTEITSRIQRVQVSPGGQIDLFGGIAGDRVPRMVVVKVTNAVGKLVFRSVKVATVEPGGEPLVVELQAVEGATGSVGELLTLRVLDADDEEVLDSAEVKLKVDLDEWD